MEKGESIPRPHPQGKHVLPPQHNSFVITFSITTYRYKLSHVNWDSWVKFGWTQLTKLWAQEEKTDAAWLDRWRWSRLHRDQARARGATNRRPGKRQQIVGLPPSARSLIDRTLISAGGCLDLLKNKPRVDSSSSRPAAASACGRAAQHTATSRDEGSIRAPWCCLFFLLMHSSWRWWFVQSSCAIVLAVRLINQRVGDRAWLRCKSGLRFLSFDSNSRHSASNRK